MPWPRKVFSGTGVGLLVAILNSTVLAGSTTQPAETDRDALLRIRELLLKGDNQAALKAANHALGQGGATTTAATQPAIAVSPAPTTQPAVAVAAPNADVQRFNLHFQTTVIAQKHAYVSAKYTGSMSIQQKENTKTSLTSALFSGLNLPWEGCAIYFDPEVAGGGGIRGGPGRA